MFSLPYAKAAELLMPLQPMPEPVGRVFYTDLAKAWVYMARCSDGSLYTGWSYNVLERVKTHNKGRGAKYTRVRRPVILVYRQQRASASDALREECRIKKLSRAQKEKLIVSSQNELNNQTSS